MKTQLLMLFAVLVCPAFGRGLSETTVESVREQGARQIETTTYVKAQAEKLAKAGFAMEDRRTFVMDYASNPAGRQVTVVQMQQFIKPSMTPVQPSPHAPHRPGGPQRKVVFWKTLVVVGFDGVAQKAQEKHVRPVRMQDRSVNVASKTERMIRETLEASKITEGLKAVMVAKFLAQEPQVKAILEHPFDGQGKSAYELARWVMNADRSEYLRDIVRGYFAL